MLHDCRKTVTRMKEQIVEKIFSRSVNKNANANKIDQYANASLLLRSSTPQQSSPLSPPAIRHSSAIKCGENCERRIHARASLLNTGDKTKLSARAKGLPARRRIRRLIAAVNSEIVKSNAHTLAGANAGAGVDAQTHMATRARLRLFITFNSATTRARARLRCRLYALLCFLVHDVTKSSRRTQAMTAAAAAKLKRRARRKRPTAPTAAARARARARPSKQRVTRNQASPIRIMPQSRHAYAHLRARER